MQIIDGSVTVSKGFSANGVACGIKKRKKDMALVVSEVQCSFAGSFTTNLVKAAPVLWDQKLVASQDHVKAIVINSGNANACTAEQGLKDTEATAAYAGSVLGCKAEEVLVCSTGVIGVPLPMDKVKEGIELCSKELSTSREASGEAALAICTTDTFKKEVAVSVQIEGRTVHIGGMAKGSGMIHPNMATMLSFIVTDAAVHASVLQQMLRQSVAQSFNAVTVDGDTSTNDTVLLLANGKAGNAEICSLDSADGRLFRQCLDDLCLDLALQIVKDGEGATKFITVHVKGAASRQEADQAARTVANSSLVKTAFFGEDANWGRIIAALGRAGIDVDPDRVDISFDEVMMVRDGLGLGPEQEKLATGVLKQQAFAVVIDLKTGQSEAKVYTCDLSLDYIRINADYRS